MIQIFFSRNMVLVCPYLNVDFNWYKQQSGYSMRYELCVFREMRWNCPSFIYGEITELLWKRTFKRLSYLHEHTVSQSSRKINNNRDIYVCIRRFRRVQSKYVYNGYYISLLLRYASLFKQHSFTYHLQWCFNIFATTFSTKPMSKV